MKGKKMISFGVSVEELETIKEQSKIEGLKPATFSKMCVFKALNKSKPSD